MSLRVRGELSPVVLLERRNLMYSPRAPPPWPKPRRSGLVAAAQDHYQRLLSVAAEVLGPDHLDTLTAPAQRHLLAGGDAYTAWSTDPEAAGR
jgi:hypothetical protein